MDKSCASESSELSVRIIGESYMLDCENAELIPFRQIVQQDHSRSSHQANQCIQFTFQTDCEASSCIITASLLTIPQENISTYLSACTNVAKIPQAAQFDTTDLYENKGMLKVIQHLDYVSR